MNAPADSPVRPAGSIRLARFLASCGVASRRACEELIQRGLVRVNGAIVSTPATSVVPGDDRVDCRGVPVQPQAPVWLLLNKPAGYTCSARDAHAARLVFELLPAHLGRLFSVGRLDRDSEGLLVLTNDGDLAQRLAHPSRQVRKTYLVEAQGALSRAALAGLRQGITDAGEFLRPLTVALERAHGDQVCLRFVLQEGRKREVRRLCAAVGLKVLRLRRTMLGPLCLGQLRPGEWRHLDAAEIAALRHAQTPESPRTPSAAQGPAQGSPAQALSVAGSRRGATHGKPHRRGGGPPPARDRSAPRQTCRTMP
jgi:23S rRNA pseudouridine2605 synthase